MCDICASVHIKIIKVCKKYKVYKCILCGYTYKA